MPKGSEVATLDQGIIDQLGPMGRVLVGIDPPQPLDPEQVSQRIRAAALTAKTPDELFAASQALSLEELFGVPLEVVSAHLLPSSFDGEGPAVFMVFEAVRLDLDERVIVSTSAQNVMDAIGTASDRGWSPFRFKVTKAERASAQGYFPYRVESV